MTKRPSLGSNVNPRRAPLPEPSAPAKVKSGKSETDDRVILSIWVDPALRQHLRVVAVQQNVTLNALLQRYIHAGLQNDGETPR